MKRDAHYYALLTFCRACGFTKESACKIAYSSQFVDDAKINVMYIENPESVMECDRVDNRPAFFNMATAHSYFRIKTFNYEAMINNTSAFHFVPGCKGDNFTKKLRCQEESPVIMEILQDVLMEDDLIKLGIALHAYADTFTHQGFSGLLSKVNDIKNCEVKTTGVYLSLPDQMIYTAKKMVKMISPNRYNEVFDRFIPAYGHGQALRFPDIPYLEWSYEYDYSDEFNDSYKVVHIDNRERFKRAFTKIKELLVNYITKHNDHIDNNIKFENFDSLFDALVLEATRQERESNWIRILLEQDLFDEDEQDSLVYEQDNWLKQAFSNYNPEVFNSRRVDRVQLANNFLTSDWYDFYLASKWYKTKFFKYCTKQGLSIPH